jgi:1,4-alpha-glucan branching enzyme
MAKARFEVNCPGAREVFLAGEFNDWDPAARRMKRVRKGGDAFVAVLDLDPGRYEFKYVADGEWHCSPDSPRVPNEQGTENSVIEVAAE